MENRQNLILNNVDYLCKGKKAKVLRGNISEVVLSVTIKDANTVAICAFVAVLMIFYQVLAFKNAKTWSKMPISVKFNVKTLL